MSKIVNLIITALFIFGTGYSVKLALNTVEKTTLKRIKKGLSKSEPFAQQLTGKKLTF